MNGETCNEARLKFSLAGEVAVLTSNAFLEILFSVGR